MQVYMQVKQTQHLAQSGFTQEGMIAYKLKVII